MKLLFMRSLTRRGRYAWAVGGLLLLVAAAAWLLWERSVVGKPPPQAARPLAPVVEPQDFRHIYQHQRAAVRASLVEALALERQVGYLRRIEVLRAIAGQLAAAETELLVAALLASRPPGVNGGEFSTWFHEIANLLHRQSAPSKAFARALATVAADPARDAVLRDYALQHLRVVWNNAGGDASLRSSIEASLRRLARGDDPPATAALLSLHLLGDTAAAPGRPVARALGDDELAALAGSLLAGPAGSSDTPRRMTAARIAADRRLAALRPVLARVASDPAEHTLARMSAINAIGRIGERADRPLLESLAAAEPALALAARDALALLP